LIVFMGKVTRGAPPVYGGRPPAHGDGQRYGNALKSLTFDSPSSFQRSGG
jgi:hypothetical protein